MTATTTEHDKRHHNGKGSTPAWGDDANEVIVALLELTGRGLWWLVRTMRWHPLAAVALVLAAAGMVLLGPELTAVYAAIGAGYLGAWRLGWPDSFARWPGSWWRSGWRREWVYRRRWRKTSLLAGLGTRLEGNDELPRLGRVRSDRYSDTVEVRMVLGQEPPDWERRLDRLAQAFRAKECRCVNIKPGCIVLRFLVKDPLEQVVAPLPVIPADQVDLEAVPVGITEDGKPWCRRIRGSQNVLGGKPGSGKSGLIWALLHSLGDAIHKGTVQVWAIDPKGGMELADAEPMFSRYAYVALDDDDENLTAELALPMIELLEEAARLVLRRAGQLRGTARKMHTPTRLAPHVIVIVDELLYLTTLLPDDPKLQLKRRAAVAMGIICSQGRAPGVSMFSALQDVRKEAVGWRDLMDERTAFGMAEASQADLVLGPGARDLGARCEFIDLPGVAYIRRGPREIVRARVAWHDDARNRWLAATYPAPPPLDVVDVTARDGGPYTLGNDRPGDGEAAA